MELHLEKLLLLGLLPLLHRLMFALCLFRAAKREGTLRATYKWSGAFTIEVETAKPKPKS